MVGAPYRNNDNAPPSEAWTKLYDYAGGSNLIYEGFAKSGQATSAAVWAIKQYSYTGNNLTEEAWAGGSSAPTNIWDNRASLIYS